MPAFVPIESGLRRAGRFNVAVHASPFSCCSVDDVRHEPARVVGDQSIRLANAHASGGVVDDPTADDRVVALEVGDRVEGLVDVAFLTVFTRGNMSSPRRYDGDVRALSRQKGFLHVLLHLSRPTEVGREEIRVVREELPHDREDALVGEHHFPGRLDPEHLGERGREVFRELLVHEPFPRVELEEVVDRLVGTIDIDFVDVIPSDLRHRELDRGEARLLRRVHEVGDGHGVFGLALVSEVHRSGLQVPFQFPPLFDEPFMDRGELVRAREELFTPQPLYYRRLDETRRGVGVVLEHLRRVLAVVGQVEASIDARVFVLPGVLDERDGLLGDAEFGVATILDHVADGDERHPRQIIRRPFDLERLGQAEPVVGALVPVRALRARVVREALTRDDLSPVGSRGDLDPLHVQPPELNPWPAPVAPKPPREKLE